MKGLPTAAAAPPPHHKKESVWESRLACTLISVLSLFVLHFVSNGGFRSGGASVGTVGEEGVPFPAAGPQPAGTGSQGEALAQPREIVAIVERSAAAGPLEPAGAEPGAGESERAAVREPGTVPGEVPAVAVALGNRVVLPGSRVPETPRTNENGPLEATPRVTPRVQPQLPNASRAGIAARPVATVRNTGSIGERTTVDVQATFQRIWIEPNVEQSGTRGMEVHVGFEMSNPRRDACDLLIQFRRSEGGWLRDRNGELASADGRVEAAATFQPTYAESVCRDYSVFIPYEELHLREGTHSLAIEVLIADGTSGREVVRSTAVPFEVTWKEIEVEAGPLE